MKLYKCNKLFHFHKTNETTSRKNGGFTLIEMLVVVGIIAVLVSVAVPVLNNQLESSREATDIANMRTARSVATAAFVAGDLEPGIDNVMYFNGGLSATRTGDMVYGKGSAQRKETTQPITTSDCDGCQYYTSQNYNASFLVAYADLDENIHVHWANNDLNFAPASSKLPSGWMGWGRTDSRGVGGTVQRANVLRELGLSDKHEYAIEKRDNGLVDVYIYDGNFPEFTRNRAELVAFLGGERKSVNTFHYVYNSSTGKTEFKDMVELEAGIRPNGSNYFIQMKEASKWT